MTYAAPIVQAKTLPGDESHNIVIIRDDGHEVALEPRDAVELIVELSIQMSRAVAAQAIHRIETELDLEPRRSA